MDISEKNEANKHQIDFKTFCLIGDPVNHSLSPLIQNSAFAALNLNYSYITFKVTAEELAETISSLRKINIAGLNVTIPHKVNIIKYIDDLSPEARLAGAVNTINNEKGHFIGYNTDIYGLIDPIEKRQISLNNIEILILGAGGSCRAALISLVQKNQYIHRINIINRDQNKLQKVIKLGKGLGLNCIPHDYSNKQKLKDISLNSKLIINTTSIGLNNEKSPLEIDFINKDSFVFDIIYKPIFTDLLEKAKKAGANLIFGYEMLLYQGAKAFEIWTGKKAPVEIMRKALLGIFGEPK